MRRFVLDIDFSKTDMIKYLEFFQQNSYPETYQFRSQQLVSWGYGDKNRKFSEFLDITVDQYNKKVSIERDLKGTLILFYYYSGNRLIITSDYNYFAQQLDLKNMINYDFLKLTLWNGKHALGSITKQINILYPRKLYFFDQEGLSVKQVYYKSETIQLENILHQNFCNFNEYNIVGAEISWGKDSAFLPILSKKSTYFPFKVMTWQKHSGEVGQLQQFTLSGIRDFLEIPSEYHDITDEDFPLRNEISGVITHPIEEIYKNSLLGEIAILKKYNVNTVFIWFGGDESFEDSNDVRTVFIQDEVSVLKDIFTPQFIEDVDVLNNNASILFEDGLFQNSLYESLITRNNIFIHNGIWPITPYLNLDLYCYLQELRITKKQFFEAFYNNFDSKLRNIFDKNTNMRWFFSQYCKSAFFRNLLETCTEKRNCLHSYYNLSYIYNNFLWPKEIDDKEIIKHWFSIYKFVKMSLMLK